jgi:hypothetical protein
VTLPSSESQRWKGLPGVFFIRAILPFIRAVPNFLLKVPPPHTSTSRARISTWILQGVRKYLTRVPQYVFQPSSSLIPQSLNLSAMLMRRVVPTPQFRAPSRPL